MYLTFNLLLNYYVLFGNFAPTFQMEKPINDYYSLSIEIEGIIIKKGTLYLAIYSTEDSFMKDPYQKMKFTSNKFPGLLTILNLPRGEYAVTIFQDLNENGKLDKFFSVPIEPYGISNNVNVYPDFENAKIKLSKNESIKINIKN